MNSIHKALSKSQDFIIKEQNMPCVENSNFLLLSD